MSKLPWKSWADLDSDIRFAAHITSDLFIDPSRFYKEIKFFFMGRIGDRE
jgi:hypothetical protein